MSKSDDIIDVFADFAKRMMATLNEPDLEPSSDDPLCERKLYEPILAAALELAGFVDCSDDNLQDGTRYFGVFPSMKPYVIMNNDNIKFYTSTNTSFVSVWTSDAIHRLLNDIRDDLAADDAEEADVLYGLEVIAAERWRQIHHKKFDSKHDEKYENAELIKTALVYLMRAVGFEDARLKDIRAVCDVTNELNTTEDMLVKAGALIAAELDRIKMKTTKALVNLADEIMTIRKFESDKEALDLLLSRGINIDKGIIHVTRDIDEDEGAAIGYLCAEWGYDTNVTA